jgi:hypothetical protein
MKRQNANPGSNNAWLETFALGERRYLETTIEGYGSQMRIINTPKSRRPLSLQEREYSTQLFTAVAACKVGEIRWLLCIERIK